MDLIEYNKHKSILGDSTGLYLITHILYPNYVKIGLGKPIQPRIGAYKTYSPKNDFRIHAVALKRSDRFVYSKDVPKSFAYIAEDRLLTFYRGKKNRSSEWINKPVEEVIEKMKEYHFGNDPIKGDGLGMPFFIFHKDSVKRIEKQEPKTRKQTKNQVVTQPQRRGERKRETSLTLLRKIESGIE